MPAFNANTKTATIVAGICAFAVAAWAFYAWKTSPDAAPASDGVSAINDTTLARSDAAGSNPRDDEADSVVDDSEGMVPLAAALGNPGGDAHRPGGNGDANSAALGANTTTPHGAADAAAGDAALRPPVEADLEAGFSALDRGDQITAREVLSRALLSNPPAAEQERIRTRLTQLSNALIFSRHVRPDDPLTQTHIVKTGDNLFLFAKQHKVPPELLQRINGIDNPHMLQVGQRLKLVTGPFRAVIYKDKHRMDVFDRDLYIRSFEVGLGADDGTPLGKWVVGNKIVDPDWKDPVTGRYYPPADPENPIGKRWISLECIEGECLGRTGFGIHGTLDPNSIGSDQSMGCVRLLAEDVALVFDLLVPRESFVEIRP